MKNNKSNITKDDEFNISLSIEDIDKIDEEIKNIENNVKTTPYKSNMIESEKEPLIEEQRNHNVINGVILLNTCVTCNDKFKPLNSMINETTCNSCL
ncbi:hypothetical protein [Nitrosopumilus sp.]|uniref:hypothetical protein n=1 Tax=Nitrosopumilus sp. TaxID=2024843 RepID=UPI0034A04209